MDEIQIVEPINNEGHLKKVIEAGFSIKGPRNDSERDLKALTAQIKKGKEFTPENWLSNNSYKFVEPSTFTKGHRIAYKIINGFPDERFNSNYSLIKDNREIPLYLKAELPKQ